MWTLKLLALLYCWNIKAFQTKTQTVVVFQHIGTFQSHHWKLVKSAAAEMGMDEKLVTLWPLTWVKSTEQTVWNVKVIPSYRFFLKCGFGSLGQRWAPEEKEEEEGRVEATWSPLTLWFVCSALVRRYWKLEVRKFKENWPKWMSCGNGSKKFLF